MAGSASARLPSLPLSAAREAGASARKGTQGRLPG